MCAAHVASMTGFSAYATLLPRLQGEWGLNNSQAGFISGAFFAGYMAAVPLLTSLTDRVDARRVYLVSSVVAGVGLAGMALLAKGLISASLLQLLAGAGIAGTYMPGLRALTDNVTGTGAQSRAVSFYTAVFGLGTSLSILLSGWIADTLGFRWAFGLGAIGPLVAGLMVTLGLTPRRPAHAHLAGRVHRVRAGAADARRRGACGLVGRDGRGGRQSLRAGGEHRRQRAGDAPRPRAADL